MPKTPTAQDLISQNGHNPNDPNPLAPPPDLIHSNQLQPPGPSHPLEASQDDWSGATHELIDTLPQVWSRGVIYLLVFFTAITLPWAMLSKVDQTGSARGRLEPKGKTIQLDAPVAGTVAAINVEEGESVKAGQRLLELESEIIHSDLQQAQAKLAGQQNQLTQLQLLKNQLETTLRTQRLQSQALATEQLTQIHQTQQQLDFHQAASNMAAEILAMDQSTLQRFRRVQQAGAIAAIRVDEAERSLIESQQQLEQIHLDQHQSQSELQKQQSAYERVLREGELTAIAVERQLKELQVQMTDLKAAIAQTQNQIEALQFQWRQRVLYAPKDGVIFQLFVHNAGAVVQPSQMIAQIAPTDAPLLLRAQMDSKESGFLQVGLPVKIKFDAYPFQDYGVVEGRLSRISPDSKILQTGQSQREIFELEIELAQPYIQTPRQRIALTPGQTATAEVVIRQRRVIDFFLDPFKKLQKGGLEL
ncbi:MAG: HlyD family type I secretion periplasmic adaptor subunit [Leptolyngbyaceae cyanobacterium MO_188.B28]|nr:HlyD family type I secretion periplasmic adaptor subunit [Leptolyngbyaceae cyanobacterium MO_188.B28]